MSSNFMDLFLRDHSFVQSNVNCDEEVLAVLENSLALEYHHALGPGALEALLFVNPSFLFEIYNPTDTMIDIAITADYRSIACLENPPIWARKKVIEEHEDALKYIRTLDTFTCLYAFNKHGRSVLKYISPERHDIIKKLDMIRRLMRPDDESINKIDERGVVSDFIAKSRPSYRRAIKHKAGNLVPEGFRLVCSKCYVDWAAEGAKYCSNCGCDKPVIVDTEEEKQWNEQEAIRSKFGVGKMSLD